jgi:hypothetical protein
MDSEKIALIMKSLVGGGPWMLIKGMFVIGLFVYLMFGLIIVRQALTMNETIEAKYNGIVKTGAWLHFGLTLFVLGVAVVFL